MAFYQTRAGKKNAIKTYLGLAIFIAMLIGKLAYGSTYTIDGVEATKGECILALMKNPKVKVIKSDEMRIDMDKGTLKTKTK